MPLHFSSTSDSNSESLIFARCGLMMRPLLENTRCTGAELAGQHQHTRWNRLVSSQLRVLGLQKHVVRGTIASVYIRDVLVQLLFTDSAALRISTIILRNLANSKY